MLSWSAKRRLSYVAVVFFFFGAAVFLFGVALFYERASCKDGKRSQGELGVDCGGPCPRLCRAETLSPLVQWVRIFKVREGIYSVLAYAENLNDGAVVFRAPYLFKLYDGQNILVYEARGETFIPARRTFGVFEGSMFVGSRKPARAVFEFAEDLKWEIAGFMEPDLDPLGEVVLYEESLPRVEVNLRNKTIYPALNIDLVAVVYDKTENALAASRTVIDRLEAGESYPAVFTWPEPFPAKAGRLEFLYKSWP